jgi:hypothetical protein
VEMEVDESFAQRKETHRRICRQSDIEKARASNGDDESDEFPDLANVGVSDDDTESCSNAADAPDAPDDDSDQDLPVPQQKKPKVSVG